MEEPEDYDPNVVLPQMLLEQESHDLICPVCEHAVTGEVILQKRKREPRPEQSEGRPHGVQARLHGKNVFPDSSISVKQETSEEGEAEMCSTVHEQTNYEVLCPDCESCITHAVIFRKRKKGTSTSHRSHHLQSGTRRGGAKGRHGHSGREDPPLKRHRQSHKEIEDTGLDGREIRKAPQNQTIFDLSCPDCASSITYQVILKLATNAPGKAVGLLEKRSRPPKKPLTSSIDDNPWETRYKQEQGTSKAFAVPKYGDIESRSLAEPLLPVQDDGEEGTPPTSTVGRWRHITSKFTNFFESFGIGYFLVFISLYCFLYLLMSL